jgi:hypothetical protein
MKMTRRPIHISKFVGQEIFIIAMTGALFVRYLYRHDVRGAFVVWGSSFVLFTGINFWMNRSSRNKEAKTNERPE